MRTQQNRKDYEVKVLLAGDGYGAGNIGDEAILEGILYSLSNEHVQIKVLSFHPDVTMRMYKNYGIETAPFWSYRRTWKDIREADIVVLGGGTLVDDSWGIGFPINHLVRLIRLAKLFRKKIMIHSIGVNPLTTNKGRKLVKKHYAKARIITTRDKESKKMLESIGIDSNKVLAVADPAFLIKPIEAKAAAEMLQIRGIEKRKGLKLIGVSAVREKGENLNYRRQLARACDTLVDKHKASIVFFSMECRIGEDYEANAAVMSMMKHRSQFLSVEFYHPCEMAGIIKQFDLTIGLRMHFLLLSSVVNVPFIAISRQKKVDNFMNLFGYKCAGNAKDIVSVDIIKQSDEIFKNYREHKEVIRKAVLHLKETAMESREILLTL